METKNLRHLSLVLPALLALCFLGACGKDVDRTFLDATDFGSDGLLGDVGQTESEVVLVPDETVSQDDFNPDDDDDCEDGCDDDDGFDDIIKNCSPGSIKKLKLKECGNFPGSLSAVVDVDALGVSAAWVALNRTMVFFPRDFHNQPSVQMSRNVQLKEGTNEMLVCLAGSPGDELAVEVFLLPRGDAPVFSKRYIRVAGPPNGGGADFETD